MELRSGYKQTEIGLVPEDWRLIPLGDFLHFRNGVNAAKEAYGAGTPFVNLLEVITYTHIHCSQIPGRVTLAKKIVASYSLRRGDLLFNRTSETQEEVGLTSVYADDEEAVFGGFVICGRPNAGILDVIFSGYAFRTPVVRRQITACGQGAIRANIGQADLRKVQALLPPPGEQRAIGVVLGDADALIDALDKLIAKKRDLKQAAMQQLLTGKRRLQGFKGEWEVRAIGRFTDCTSGGTPSTSVPGYWGGTIKWMSSGELNFKIIWDVEGRITEYGLQSSSATMIPEKCVLVGLAGQGKTRGTVAINMIPLCTNQSIAAILPSEEFVPEYLYHNLDYRYEELRGLSTGQGGRGGLNLTIIKSIPVPFPTIKEQAAIAAVLSDMDAEIAVLEQRRDKIRALKQGMMQELLTGKTRLI